MVRRGLLLASIVSAVLLAAYAPGPAGHSVKRVGRNASKSDPPEPVDLNDASESALRSVPGITSKTARMIVEGRPYESVAELAKAGVARSTISRIRMNVIVSGQASKPERAAAGGQAGMVWVRSGSKVYHEPGDRWYGKTADGRYMSEKDAIAAGLRPSKER